MRHASPLGLLVVAGLAAADEPKANPAAYRSPYSVQWTFTDLTDDLAGPRGDLRQSSTVPFAEWYSPTVRDKYGAWGPPVRHYPAPDGIAKRSAAWQRERVLAVGLRYVGYSYQHHHLPDWAPPDGWPWKEVGRGVNGKGIDCSNFTAFAYNLGLGIKFTSDIKKQCLLTEALGPDGKPVPVERIEVPKAHADFAKVLRTGDLLFVRNSKGDVSHVVLWVGSIGRAPDGEPLILDSTSTGHKDSNGTAIPDGVYLRPFRAASWYCKSASHVLRVSVHGAEK